MIGALLLVAAVQTPVDVDSVLVPGAVAVVIAGQSNAAGRGRMLPEDSIPEPNVYVSKGDGLAYPGSDPFDWFATGTGFGRTLAADLVASGLAPQVWIVQCAVGETSARQWAGDELPPFTFVAKDPQKVNRLLHGRLYGGCVMQALPLTRRGVRIVAVAWHQGENGCGNAAAAAKQADYLTEIRSHFLQDFPGSVFVGGELAQSDTCPYRETVNQATRDVADAFVPSDGLLAPGPGNVHFDRASLREFGHRYAAAILGLIAP